MELYEQLIKLVENTFGTTNVELALELLSDESYTRSFAEEVLKLLVDYNLVSYEKRTWD